MLYVQYPSWIRPEIVSFLPVRWYGLMYVVAFFTSYIIILSYIKKEKNTTIEEKIPNIYMWAFIGMIIGARLVSELVYSRNFSILIQPWMIIWPFQNGRFTGIQGMSYHGGVIGISLAVFIYCKVSKIAFAPFADKAVIGAALGYTFGRIGNFTNGELFGRITSAPIGMIFPHAELLPIADPRVADIATKIGIEANQLGLVNLPRHPSQLYEAFSEGILTWAILALVYKLLREKKFYVQGSMVALYVMLYATARFIVEYFRQPDTGLDFVIRLSDQSNPNWLFTSLLNFTTGQVLSFVMFTIGLGFLLFLVLRNKQNTQKQTVKLSP